MGIETNEKTDDKKEKVYCDDCGVELIEGWSCGHRCVACFGQEEYLEAFDPWDV